MNHNKSFLLIKIHLVIILVIILCADESSLVLAIEATCPAAQWERTFGGARGEFHGEGCLTYDGGYIVAGATSSFGGGGAEAYLVKVGSGGDLQWQDTIGMGGVGRYIESFTSVQQTSDGGYVMTGSLAGTSLIKNDSGGNVQWQKPIEESYAKYECVRQSSDTGYIITGYRQWDVFLLKTDPSGTTEWEKTYDIEKTDRGYDVRQTSDGGYIVLAMSDCGNPVRDICLIKTNSYGEIEWQETYPPGYPERYLESGSEVHQTFDGGYIIVGMIANGIGLIKTNSIGGKQWIKIHGAPEDPTIRSVTGSEGSSIQEVSGGGYVIAGRTNLRGADGDDVYVIGIDSAGNLLWEETFGGIGDESADCIQQIADGGYIVSGLTYSFGMGGSDIYLLKIGGTEDNSSLQVMIEPQERLI